MAKLSMFKNQLLTAISSQQFNLELSGAAYVCGSQERYSASVYLSGDGIVPAIQQGHLAEVRVIFEKLKLSNFRLTEVQYLEAHTLTGSVKRWQLVFAESQ